MLLLAVARRTVPSTAADAAVPTPACTPPVAPGTWEVLEQYATGRSAIYIAEVLGLSEQTVKTHVRHAYAKMDVHSRQELLDRLEEVPIS